MDHIELCGVVDGWAEYSLGNPPPGFLVEDRRGRGQLFERGHQEGKRRKARVQHPSGRSCGAFPPRSHCHTSHYTVTLSNLDTQLSHCQTVEQQLSHNCNTIEQHCHTTFQLTTHTTTFFSGYQLHKGVSLNGYHGKFDLRATLYLQLVPANHLEEAQRNRKLTSEQSTLGLTLNITRTLIGDVRIRPPSVVAPPRAKNPKNTRDVVLVPRQSGVEDDEVKEKTGFNCHFIVLLSKLLSNYCQTSLGTKTPNPRPDLVG
jgi:hypothetical protein